MNIHEHNAAEFDQPVDPAAALHLPEAADPWKGFRLDPSPDRRYKISGLPAGVLEATIRGAHDATQTFNLYARSSLLQPELLVSGSVGDKWTANGVTLEVVA